MGLSSMIGSCSSTLEEVIVTGDLATRRRVEVDPSRLKQALLDIGSRMAEDPTGVLQRFADLAMEIGGGVSSGISVLEDATPAFFRWQFLRGSLAAFEGATTPRNYSPCGMTLDADAPVLARHPERYYVWIADAGITVSMSRRANCYDNAPMESANGTLKVERVHDRHYATRQQAIDHLTDYFGYCNTERRHSALAYLSPAEFEQEIVHGSLYVMGRIYPNLVEYGLRGTPPWFYAVFAAVKLAPLTVLCAAIGLCVAIAQRRASTRNRLMSASAIEVSAARFM